jgi:hypothetical protein
MRKISAEKATLNLIRSPIISSLSKSRFKALTIWIIRQIELLISMMADNTVYSVVCILV